MIEPVEIVSEGTADQERPANRSRRRIVLLAGVAILAIGVAFWATRDDAPGGATSPAAAVTELIAAVEAQDALEIAALLPPDEAAYVRLASFADQRFAALGTYDLRVEGAEASGETELAPGIVEVALTRDAVEVSGGDAELLGRAFQTDRRPVGLFGPDLRLVAVEEDGRWFVSPLYSLSQWLVARLDLPQPSFSATPIRGGVDAAGEVPGAVASALAGEDLDAVLSLVDVDGGRWAAAYRDAIAEVLDRTGVDPADMLPAVDSIDIEDNQVSSRAAPGGRRALTVEAASIRTTSGRYRYRDSCVVAEADGADQICVPPELFERSAISDRLTVIVRQGPDGWRVDLLGTFAFLAEQALAGGDVDALLRAVGRADLATVTPIEAGTIVEVSTNAAGFATLSFDARRPGLYSVGFGDRFDRAVVTGGGAQVECAVAPCVIRVTDPGERLLTVWQQRYAVTRAPVLVTPVSPDDVDDGDAVTGTSTGVGPAAVLRLRGDADPIVRPAGVDLVDAELRPVDCPDDLCPTVEGDPYFLIVRTIGPYDFTIRRQSEIEFVTGGKTVQGFIGNPGDSGVFEVRLREGVEIDFGIRGERGLDISLRVRDPDGNEVGVVDDSGPDGFEGFRLRPKKSGVYRVELTGIDGSTGLWFADLLVEGEDY